MYTCLCSSLFPDSLSSCYFTWPQNHSVKIKSLFLKINHKFNSFSQQKVIKNLKGKSSSGFDGVTEPIVKKCVQIIKKPLANICNTSFAPGTSQKY